MASEGLETNIPTLGHRHRVETTTIEGVESWRFLFFFEGFKDCAKMLGISTMIFFHP